MAATPVFETVLTDTVGATTYTFSGADIGTAASDRIVVVVCHTEGATAALSSITIGGSTADIRIQANNGNVVTAIATRLVTTGTTADIVVTWDTATLRCVIGIYTVTGANETPVATDSAAAASGTASSLTVTIPADGCAINGDTHGTGSTPTTWGGSSAADYNETPGTNTQMSGSLTPSTGSLRTDHNITTSHANSAQPIAAATVVWESGVVTHTSTGAPSITNITSAGTAEVINTATGAPSITALTSQGTAEVINTATGSPSIGNVTSEGTADVMPGAVDTDVRVTFPTPTDAPDDGAGLQAFRVVVRKDSFHSPGTGVPTVDIYLYEGGTEGVRAGHRCCCYVRDRATYHGYVGRIRPSYQ